jgi:hypothetical protein
MNTWVEAPPPKRLGCFARGCLILLGFATVLAIAGALGVYWGSRHYSAVVRGMYWLTRTHAISQKPVPVPQYQTSDARIEAAQERWRDFEAAVRAGQPARIELNADEINDLIAADPRLRGKMFVSIIGNRLRLETSMPMKEVSGYRGYYFNGDIKMQLGEPESLTNPRLTGITINNQPLPAGVLNWKYRAERLQDYLSDFLEPWNTTTLEIREGKVILQSLGGSSG